MRDFINAATTGSGGVTFGGAISGQIMISAIGLVFMIAFGAWGAWLKWRDSKAIREALDSGDLRRAIEVRNKL